MFTKQIISELNEHNDTITALGFSPNGSMIVTAGKDSIARL